MVEIDSFGSSVCVRKKKKSIDFNWPIQEIVSGLTEFNVSERKFQRLG